jgi:protoporphyrinogen oxidase
MDLICNTLGIARGDVRAWAEMRHLLPVMRLEHLDMAVRVDALRSDSHVFMTGNYYYGLSLEDCVIRAEVEAERYEAVNGL